MRFRRAAGELYCIAFLTSISAFPRMLSPAHAAPVFADLASRPMPQILSLGAASANPSV
jgi:hypothetical protein